MTNFFNGLSRLFGNFFVGILFLMALAAGFSVFSYDLYISKQVLVNQVQTEKREHQRLKNAYNHIVHSKEQSDAKVAQLQTNAQKFYTEGQHLKGQLRIAEDDKVNLRKEIRVKDLTINNLRGSVSRQIKVIRNLEGVQQKLQSKNQKLVKTYQELKTINTQSNHHRMALKDSIGVMTVQYNYLDQQFYQLKVNLYLLAFQIAIIFISFLGLSYFLIVYRMKIKEWFRWKVSSLNGSWNWS